MEISQAHGAIPNTVEKIILSTFFGAENNIGHRRRMHNSKPHEKYQKAVKIKFIKSID